MVFAAHALAALTAFSMFSGLSMASVQQDAAVTGYIARPYEVAVADDLAARQVIARLNHALDAGDYALYGSFFAEDGVFESDFGDAVGPQEVAAALELVRPFITNKRHVAANPVINRDGEQLVVTTYLIVFERAANLDFVGSAVNVDTLEAVDGVWKVVRHQSALDPATAEMMRQAMTGPAAPED